MPDDFPNKKVNPSWEKIALWIGILATVAGFTGYTMKDFFEKKEKPQLEQKKVNSNEVNLESKSNELPKTNTETLKKKSNKDNKISQTQMTVQNKGEKFGDSNLTNKRPNTIELSKNNDKSAELGLVMRIFDLETGNPIEGVSVQLENSIEVLHTDKNGCFVIEVVPHVRHDSFFCVGIHST